MRLNKKYNKKIKLIFGIIYVVILAVYAVFLFDKFLPNEHNEDLNLFGKSIYVLDNGQAVSVDYSKKPTEGDKIVCIANNKKYLATVLSDDTSSNISIQADINGSNQYYTIKASNGVVNQFIPKLGKIYNFMHSVYGLVCIVIVPCALIILYEAAKIIMALKNKHKHNIDDNNSYNDDNNSYNNYETGPNNSAINDNMVWDSMFSFQPDKAKNNLDKEDFLDENNKTESAETLPDKQDETVEDNIEQSDILQKYGILTKNTDEGVEVKIDPKSIEFLSLKLNNDGTLEINTDNYTADINTEL